MGSRAGMRQEWGRNGVMGRNGVRPAILQFVTYNSSLIPVTVHFLIIYVSQHRLASADDRSVQCRYLGQRLRGCTGLLPDYDQRAFLSMLQDFILNGYPHKNRIAELQA